MSPQMEKKILEKLDRLEIMMTQIIRRDEELTEEDALKIIKEGDREYREGKTIEFDTLIQEKYPYLLEKKVHANCRN